MSDELSTAEKNALAFMARRRSILVTQVQDKSERDIFGVIVPGMAVFKKLAKKDLVIFTEEDEQPDGFRFTEEIYITSAGEKLAKKLEL